VWLASFVLFRTYRRTSTLEELRRTAGATGAGVGALLALGFIVPSLSVLSQIAGSLWILATTFELLTRCAWQALRRHPALTPRLALRTVVVGIEDEVHQAVRVLRDGDSGLHPVGELVLSQRIRRGEDRAGRLVEAIREKQAECVVVASPAFPPDEVARLVRAARLAGVEVRLTANLPELLPDRIHVEHFGSISLMSLRLPRLSGAQARVKRVLDLSIASAAIIVAGPLLLAIALAIKLASPGPVLFRQERVTREGRVFRMLKFRTMHVDADRLISDDSIDPTEPFFKLRRDPRLTRVGRFLRRTSLDELPQLLNVIRGDMTLVGPRPLPAEQVAANPTLLGPRHEVLAGITGWWQVKGRSDLSPEDAVRLDTFYIENWSLGLDVAILLRTFWAVVRRVGAY
jgi:exopolysaccharide biosynthesis polyprenyl glycosylphosphotransferase